MTEQEFTSTEMATASLEAIAAVRCRVLGDHAGFAEVMTQTEDGLALAVALAKLAAEFIERTVGDDAPAVMAMLTQYAVEQAAEAR